MTTLTTADTAPVTGGWRGRHNAGLILIVAGIGILVAAAALGWFKPESSNEPALWVWFGLLALMVAFLLLVGHGVTGNALGVLIGERNRMSLARLQMAAWTTLILSAYLTAMLANIAANEANPLDVSIPTELWLAMGISSSSLLGSRLILAEHQRNPVEPPTVEVRSDPTEASARDLFCGDFEAGKNLLDLSKVQMFFFTLVLVLGYGVATADVFVDATSEGVDALPKLDEAFVILLAISHGTYLTRKVLPDTAGAPVNTSAPAITGTPVLGGTLTAAGGEWTPPPESTVFEWQRCEPDGASCVAISGANTASYTITAEDVGKTLKVAVNATNAKGTASATSAPTGVVAST